MVANVSDKLANTRRAYPLAHANMELAIGSQSDRIATGLGHFPYRLRALAKAGALDLFPVENDQRDLGLVSWMSQEL